MNASSITIYAPPEIFNKYGKGIESNGKSESEDAAKNFSHQMDLFSEIPQATNFEVGSSKGNKIA